MTHDRLWLTRFHAYALYAAEHWEWLEDGPANPMSLYEVSEFESSGSFWRKL